MTDTATFPDYVVNIGPTVDAELTKGPNHVDLRFRTQHACFSVSLTPDTALGLISALMSRILGIRLAHE
jgi:hypothetical protein